MLATRGREGAALSCGPSAHAVAGNGRPLSWAPSAHAVAGGADAQQSPFPPYGAWHAGLTGGVVGWAGTVRMGLAFAMADPLYSPWAFNGVWFSRHADRRRAGRGSGG